MAGLYGNWSFNYRPTNPFGNLSDLVKDPIQEELFRDPKNVSSYAIQDVRGQGAPNSFMRFFADWAPGQEAGYNALVQRQPTTRTTFAEFLRDRMGQATTDYLNTNPFMNATSYMRPTRVVRR